MPRGIKKKTVSPLARSIGRLRECGWEVGITERFIQAMKIRMDYCGFADAIAFKVGQPPLAINAMHLKDRAGHFEKFASNELLKVWLACGFRFEEWQWHEVGEPKRWRLERVAWDREAVRQIAPKGEFAA